MFGVISLQDLANALNVPESTIRTWKRRGEIPSSCFKKVGNRVFVKEAEVRKWLDNSESDATTVL